MESEEWTVVYGTKKIEADVHLMATETCPETNYAAVYSFVAIWSMIMTIAPIEAKVAAFAALLILMAL